MNKFIWLMLVVAFLAVEGSTVSLVSIWFAAGALAAMLATLLGAGLKLQIGIFLAVSAAALALMRPLVRRHITPKLEKTNVDAVIGSRGYVTVPISNDIAVGAVKLGAMEWTARSVSGQEIPEGTLVAVDRIEGVKVYVYPVEETAKV